MNEKELIVKHVFGELTLGEVFGKFENDLRSIHIQSDDASADVVVNSWVVNGKKLELYGEYDLVGSFKLNTKVKVCGDHLEFKHGVDIFYMTFIAAIRFDSLLPGAL